MAAIIPWRPNESAAHVLRHWLDGACVALPTEATYELTVSALHCDALDRLGAAAAVNQSAAMVLFEYAQLRDWLPLLRGAGRRVFRKMGAGPISLRADVGFAPGLLAKLPEPARKLAAPQARLVVRWPAHPVWDELRQAGLPIISVPVEGGVTAEETAKRLGDAIACIVDAGPTKYEAMPSFVHARGRAAVIERQGALRQEQIDELALCRIVFICTGNTCRSPMAERLCAKLLADHLGCSPDELPAHGYDVQSAGLAAMAGGEASADAVRAGAEFGVDLASHRSRMVTWEMLTWADHVFVMTASHWHMLREAAAVEMANPRMLSPGHEDIADPIGGHLADYRTCAHQIMECLQQRVPELLES